MAGKWVPELMREALQTRAKRTSTAATGRHGFRPIPAGRSGVSNELGNEMRDEQGRCARPETANPRMNMEARA